MKEVYLARIDAEENSYRYYRLCLPSDSRELLLQWGRLGEYVTEKWDACASHSDAKELMAKTERQKRAEGYASADQHVLPKNYFIYQPPAGKLHATDGQLSFLDD